MEERETLRRKLDALDTAGAFTVAGAWTLPLRETESRSEKSTKAPKSLIHLLYLVAFPPNAELDDRIFYYNEVGLHTDLQRLLFEFGSDHRITSGLKHRFDVLPT